MNGLKKRVLPVLAFLACIAVIGGLGLLAHNYFYGPQAAPKHVMLTKDNFKQEVSGKGLVYIYVCMDDRYACDVQSKQVDEFQDKYGSQVKVVEVNASQQPELAAGLGIQSGMDLPAHFLVSDGKLVGGASGVFSADELAALLQQMLQQPAQPQQGAPQSGTTDGGSTTAPPAAATPEPSGK